MVKVSYEDYEKLEKRMEEAINNFVSHQEKWGQYDENSKAVALGMRSMKMVVLNTLFMEG